MIFMNFYVQLRIRIWQKFFGSLRIRVWNHNTGIDNGSHPIPCINSLIVFKIKIYESCKLLKMRQLKLAYCSLYTYSTAFSHCSNITPYQFESR
jgi:hypothetical protein